MREEDTSRLFARCYGLALGLALGAFVSTVPLAWSDAVAATCWMAGAEAGLVPAASCPGLPGFGEAADGPANPWRVAGVAATGGKRRFSR